MDHQSQVIGRLKQEVKGLIECNKRLNADVIVVNDKHRKLMDVADRNIRDAGKLIDYLNQKIDDLRKAFRDALGYVPDDQVKESLVKKHKNLLSDVKIQGD
jgi:hypothetical protein